MATLYADRGQYCTLWDDNIILRQMTILYPDNNNQPYNLTDDNLYPDSWPPYTDRWQPYTYERWQTYIHDRWQPTLCPNICQPYILADENPITLIYDKLIPLYMTTYTLTDDKPVPW